MTRRMFALAAVLVAMVTLTAADSAVAAPRDAAEKTHPRLSGYYDYRDASSEFETGIGNVQKLDCTTSVDTQPAIYTGNVVIDCDGEVPHNETAIVVDANNPDHAVGAYHSYQRSLVGSTVVTRILGTTSVTFDGGHSWREVVPPIAPYQFSGDPALAFDANGRIYFSNIADHEGQGANFTNPSIIVTYSDDGGLSYSSPVTVAPGEHTPNAPRGVFNDKEYVTADANGTSPFRNRVYVTWSRFEWSYVGQDVFDRSPIVVSYSDDGISWSAPKEIGGSHADCTVQFGGGPANQCDEDQDSSPTVGPDGRVYVAYENFNTPGENQYMVVSSSDGGVTWSSPVRVGTVFDVNYPRDPLTGRNILTGCQFRVSAAGNLVADPTDPAGNTLYLTWTDNRKGTASRTNVDVMLARSVDAGATWKVYTIDDAPNDQFYPWAAVGPDGTVNVGYMDRSYSAGQSECKYGFSVATLEFGANGKIASRAKVRVDSGLSDPGHSRWFSGATGAQSLFIGDYNGVAVGSDGDVWSLWTDQRNVVANPPSQSRNHGQHAVAARTE